MVGYTQLVQHGTSAALRLFKDHFPELKWSTVNDWKKAMVKATKNSGEDSCSRRKETKKRGRPFLLPDNITKDITSYIHALGDAGVVNTWIV